MIKYYQWFQVDLALILVLTMTTISTSVQQSLPRVSYIKAVDVWTFSCLFFVCASLLEIALVNIMSQNEIKQKKAIERKADQRQKGQKAETDTNHLPEKKAEQQPETYQTQEISKYEKIHVSSRIVFPFAFILFNAIYWWWYLSKFSRQFTLGSHQGRI